MKRNSFRAAVALTAAFTTAASPLLVSAQTAYEFKKYKPGLAVIGATPTPATPLVPQPALELSTSSVLFESTPIGGLHTRQVALTNTGDAPLTFTAVPAVQGTGFSATSTSCGTSLAALADCLVEVQFAPSTAGTATGKLVVSTALANSPHEVSLQGTGYNPLSLSSATLSAATVGSAYNVNFASYLTVTGLTSYAPANANWAVTAGALPPGMSLTSAGQLQGAPSTQGNYSFDVRVSYAGASATRSYSVTVSLAPVALVQLSSTSVNFGDVSTLASLARRVLVSNIGNASLSLTGVPSTQGTGFSVSGTSCSTTLAAAADCWVDVVYTPTAVGAASGKLTVTSTLPASPHEVTLQGNGFNPVNLATSSLTAGTTGTAYSTNLASLFSVTGDAAPNMAEVTWALASGTLPNGVTLSASGQLSGTPSAAGNYNFDVLATYRGYSARRSYAITVSTSPDANWNNVTVLLNFEGSAGTTTYTEPTKGLTLTFAGSAQLSGEKKFGNTSLSVVGGYVGMPGASFAFGTRPFTFETFVRRNTSTSGSFIILETRPAMVNGNYISATIGATGNISWYVNGASRILAPADSIPADGNWHHFAYSRDASGTGRMFVNGLQVGSSYVDSHNYGAAATAYIGHNAFSTAQVGGYVDALRVTDGVGRYTSNFSAPTAPYPVQ